MTVPCKIVIHSIHGYRPVLDALVANWIAGGVKYIGVAGVDAARIEDIIDEICVGDGSAPYFMLTASHGPDETLDDALSLAAMLSDDFPGEVQVVEL